MKAENYCPCCASDDIEFVQSEHFENGMSERMQCNYCDSIFENEYKFVKQNVINDNSETMYMLKAKEVIETELKALGDNINTSRGFADGKIHFILESLIGTLNDLDSQDLAKLYATSSYAREYEMTSQKPNHDDVIVLDELNSGNAIVFEHLQELRNDVGNGAEYVISLLLSQLNNMDMKTHIEAFKKSGHF